MCPSVSGFLTEKKLHTVPPFSNPHRTVNRTQQRTAELLHIRSIRVINRNSCLSLLQEICSVHVNSYSCWIRSQLWLLQHTDAASVGHGSAFTRRLDVCNPPLPHLLSHT